MSIAAAAMSTSTSAAGLLFNFAHFQRSCRPSSPTRTLAPFNSAKQLSFRPKFYPKSSISSSYLNTTNMVAPSTKLPTRHGRSLFASASSAVHGFLAPSLRAPHGHRYTSSFSVSCVRNVCRGKRFRRWRALKSSIRGC
ncbi:hypothetical protein BDV98DRAFT_373832 [Pterulicium gracile]|uniref:Uncharacterized protein n=1 Tax=Pterulicium gracile TaxID=1884261 RepID=A0A5C3Q2G2_9AGAR|nr:hypothetical protein BDV98DRAFT_373832 [Pterula gracilis]